MDLRNRRMRVNFHPCGRVQNADIEAKVRAQILRQGFQDPPVAAVTVDDGEIARRQRAGDLASQITHECRHALDRQRHSAGRPFMLACKAYRQRWKLPKIQGLAPAGDDAAAKFLGQHNIGIERQMGAMLLDRTDRQAKYRALAENLRDFWESKLADQSARRSVWHSRYRSMSSYQRGHIPIRGRGVGERSHE